MTAPVASHIVSRAAFRAGVVPRERLLVDDMPHPLEPEPEPGPGDVAEHPSQGATERGAARGSADPGSEDRPSAP
jgi:hypothetical protein